MTAAAATPTPAMIRGIRGATSVPHNTESDIEAAVLELLQALVSQNTIQPEAIVSVFFTVTPDLTKISPAKVARTHLNWGLVPMVCAAEPFIEELPERCVRVLIQLHTDLPPEAIRHVYLHNAATLRPDRA
jgi:chorismate mutase